MTPASPSPPTRRAFLAGSVAATITSATSRAGVDTPSFAGRVAGLSGAETGPAADNLVSNEDSYPRVAPGLGRVVPPGSAYLGVGPDQNLTYIAQACPAVAFILDHRRRNLLLHLVHKALMAVSADRAGYLSRLTARGPGRPVGPDATADDLVAAFGPSPFDRARLGRAVAEVRETLGPLGVVREDEWDAVATIQAKLAGPGLDARFLALPGYPTLGRQIRTTDRDGRPGHLLALESLYARCRSAQRADRVVPVVGDFAAGAPGPLSRIGEALRRDGLALGLVYLSDVEFFLIRAGRFDAMAAGLATLPWAEGAVVVRTSTREIGHPDRVPGDRSTTIVRPAARFLALARSGRIRRVDDLFAVDVDPDRP